MRLIHLENSSRIPVVSCRVSMEGPGSLCGIGNDYFEIHFSPTANAIHTVLIGQARKDLFILHLIYLQ